MLRHHGRLALILTVLLCTQPAISALADEDFSDDDYISDSEPDSAGGGSTLKPKYSRDLSSTESAGVLRHTSGSGPSPFSFGVFAGWDLSVGGSKAVQTAEAAPHVDSDQHSHGLLQKLAVMKCPSGVRCHGGEDHSVTVLDGAAAGGGGSLPVVTIKAGYRLTGGLALAASLPIAFSGGVRDASIGPNLSLRMSQKTLANLSLTATVPISASSQDEAKLTTVTLSLNTLWLGGGKVFAGVGGFVAGSFYRQDVLTSSGSGVSAKIRGHVGEEKPGHADEPSTSTLMAAGVGVQELVRTGVSAYGGLSLTDNLSASLSIGAGTVYKSEGDLGYVTDATLARLSYSSGGFMGAFAFSLLSDQSGTANLTLPTQPYVGLKLQYVFGRLSTLGIVGSDSLSQR